MAHNNDTLGGNHSVGAIVHWHAALARKWTSGIPISVTHSVSTIRSRHAGNSSCSLWLGNSHSSHGVGTRMRSVIDGKIPTKQISAHCCRFACKDLCVKDRLRLVFPAIDAYSAGESIRILIRFVVWVWPSTTSAETCFKNPQLAFNCKFDHKFGKGKAESIFSWEDARDLRIECWS